MFLDVLFFKRSKIYESLQVLLLERTLSSLIIPGNVTNLTISNACFAISALRCCYHAEAAWWCDCKRIVTFKCLWCKCGEIVVWCYISRNFLVLIHANSPGTVYKSPVYSIVPSQQHLCANLSALLNFKYKYRNRLNPSNNLRFSLSSCVPRYERVISEEQQQKSH